MARKKKKVTTEQPKIENKNKDIIASGTQSLNYQGTIKLSIQRGNKTLRTEVYHNSGMPNLFKFLANCLAGLNAEELRPCKIKLFKYPGADARDGMTPTNFTWSGVWQSAYKPVQVSSFVVYDAAPVVAMKLNSEVSEELLANEGNENILDYYHYETTYHFRIPSSYISDEIIHMIGLYPNGTVDNSEVSAYYLLTDDSGKKWKATDLSDESGNFSIVLEWTLEISNYTGNTNIASSQQNSSN